MSKQGRKPVHEAPFSRSLYIDGGDEEATEWAMGAIKAMRGISDPAQFMADVRALISHQAGENCMYHDKYMATFRRLAAQLKGE